MVDEEGASSEGYLKWGGEGSFRGLSKNILKQGVGKGKSCSYGGGGFESVTTPAPPPPPRKILIIHQQTVTIIEVLKKFSEKK